jgi:hypothetical protein
MIGGNFAAYFDVQTKYSVQDGFLKNEEAESSLACHSIYLAESNGDSRLNIDSYDSLLIMPGQI